VQSIDVFRQGSHVGRLELTRDPRGADTRRTRGARHFIYLPTSEAAHNVAQVLEREGWDTAVHAAEDVWLVAAGCLRVLNEPLARETRERLASLAAAHGGSYDGWEPAGT
jgi:hypothetical protein